MASKRNDSFINSGFLGAIIIILTLFSLLVTVFWFYVKNFDTSFTTDISYVGSSELVDDYDGDSLFFLEFNSFTNKNKNGVELYEMQISAFTNGNSESTDFQKFGMQAVGEFTENIYTDMAFNFFQWNSTYYTQYYHNVEDLKHDMPNGKDNEGKTITYHQNDLYYYNTQNDGMSFVSCSSSRISEDKDFYFDINKTKYNFVLKGEFETHREKDGINWNSIFKQVVTPEFMFAALHDTIVKTDKVGTYYQTIDLSKYFNINVYNEKTQKWDKPATDKSAIFMTVKVNKSDDGVVRAKQSMFGSVATDPQYNTLGETDENFYDVFTVYNLTENDFDTRISNDNLYLLTLKTEKVKELEKYKNLYIQINLNLDNSQIGGFDYFAFENIKISNIKLTSFTNKDFKFMNSYCSSNASVKKITYTSNINLIFDSVNNAELVEVKV